MSFFSIVEKWASVSPNKKFLINDENHITYLEFYNKILEISKELGMDSKNQRCLIISDGLYNQALLFMSISNANKCPIITHTGLGNEALNKIIKENSIDIIISTNMLSIDNLTYKEVNINNMTIFIYRISRGIDNNNDIGCFGVLTSGSTGVPKVLFRTYESWSEFFNIQNTTFLINTTSVVYVHGSLSFTGNFNMLIGCLFEGATIVTSKSLSRFKHLLSHSITNIYLVPTKLRIISNHLNGSYNISSIITGSEMFSIDLGKVLKKTFNDCKIFLYYGASELSYVSYLEFNDLLSKPGSVGKAFKGINISTHRGYIYVDTPYHIKGINMPYTVKDLGYIDCDGYLYFNGREDNIVSRAGIKISLHKIKNALISIEGIENSNVISIKSTLKGCNIVAFIVSSQNQDLRVIREKLKDHILDIEMPNKIIQIKDMPLNSVGKIDNDKLLHIVEGNH